METHLAKAMQISYLNEFQVERIQEIERNRRHVLPNWNIQEILKIPPIRYTHELPDDEKSLFKHKKRIERELERVAQQEGFSLGNFDETDVESCHKLDNFITAFSGRIVWENMASRPQKRLSEKLQENVDKATSIS